MVRRVQVAWQDEFIRSHPCRLDGFSQQEGRSGKTLRDAAPGPCPPLPERCQAVARPLPGWCQNGARQKRDRAVHGSRGASSLDARWSPCRKGRGNGALPGQGAGGKRAPERHARLGARKAGWSCRRQSGDFGVLSASAKPRVFPRARRVGESPSPAAWSSTL